MGEAKRRGNYEERKSQAIKAGRIKNKVSDSAIQREIMRDALSTSYNPWPMVLSYAGILDNGLSQVMTKQDWVEKGQDDN